MPTPSFTLPAYEAAQVPQHQIWLKGPMPSHSLVGVLGLNYGPYLEGAPISANAYTLIVYMAGETKIQRTINRRRERYEVGPGDISLQPACTASHWSWPNPIDVLHLYFEPRYLHDLVQEATGKPCTLHMRHGLCLRDEALFELATQLVQELESAALGVQRGVQAIGTRIALHMLRGYFDIGESPVMAAPLSPTQLSELTEWIDAHLAEDLRVERLAELLHLSVTHFSRTFGASVGISPHEYVRELRLRRAHDLLLSSNEPVSEIAGLTGFADQSHLTRWFKQRFGESPGSFRRSQRSFAR